MMPFDSRPCDKQVSEPAQSGRHADCDSCGYVSDKTGHKTCHQYDDNHCGERFNYACFKCHSLPSLGLFKSAKLTWLNRPIDLVIAFFSDSTFSFLFGILLGILITGYTTLEVIHAMDSLPVVCK